MTGLNIDTAKTFMDAYRAAGGRKLRTDDDLPPDGNICRATRAAARKFHEFGYTSSEFVDAGVRAGCNAGNLRAEWQHAISHPDCDNEMPEARTLAEQIMNHARMHRPAHSGLRRWDQVVDRCSLNQIGDLIAKHDWKTKHQAIKAMDKLIDQGFFN